VNRDEMCKRLEAADLPAERAKVRIDEAYDLLSRGAVSGDEPKEVGEAKSRAWAATIELRPVMEGLDG
jgi:hypothetical protein